MARKEKKHHFIYRTTNVITGKYYYGMHSTDDLNDNYYGSGRRLKHSLNKYGKENHKVEILEFLPNRKLLIDREIEIVNLNEIAKEDCMNLMIGGTGGFPVNLNLELFHYLGGKASSIILVNKIKTDPNYAEKHRINSSNNMKNLHLNGKSYDWKNKHHTDKTKEKMRISHVGKGIGKNNSQYDTCWITNGIENKKIKKEEYCLYSDNWYLGRKTKNE
jgi:hypothetical protein